MSDSEDDFRDTSSSTSTTRIPTIPIGYCLINVKWKKSALSQSIGKILSVKYVDNLGYADFMPSSKKMVKFLSEAEIIEGIDALKIKVDKMQQEKKGIAVYIYLQSASTRQYFPAFQNELIIHRGAALVPLTSLSQIPQFLQQLQIADMRANPFDFDHKESESRLKIHSDILLSICKIPGLGEKKARSLLERFGKIKAISRATELELSTVLGTNLAKQVFESFHKKNTL